MPEFSDEDAKLITLARGARSRIGASDGAAIRDETGRTYASASVDLPSLHLSGLQAAVAQATSAGARGLEAAVVVSDAEAIDGEGMAAVRDLAGTGVSIHLVDPTGKPQSTVRT